MQSVLLRSGNVKDYNALGHSGRTVYSVAPQIRETIRLRTEEIRGSSLNTPKSSQNNTTSSLGGQKPLQENYADYLAIPLLNEHGSRIDWYIPKFEPKNPQLGYSIVPWTSATDEERQKAFTELQTFKEKLVNHGEALSARKTSGDLLYFSRLLSPTTVDGNNTSALMLHFPSNEYIYLVDGKPVITFWGFKKKGEPPYGDPFLCLTPTPQPVKPAEPTPVTPVAQAAPAVAESSPWWRRLLFWLLALLLLLLLLFLLRGCFHIPGIPNVLPKLGINLPNLLGSEPTLPNLGLPQGGSLPLGGGAGGGGLPLGGGAGGGGLPLGGGAGGGGLPLGGGAGGGLPPEAGTGGGLPPENGTGGGLPPENGAGGGLPPENGAGGGLPPENGTGGGLPPENGGGSPAGANNNAPANGNNPAANSPTGPYTPTSHPFINGNWRAKGGIQDKDTGKPLELNYQLNNGAGTVSVKRGDGVVCTGNVNSGFANGTLSINSQDMASCTDGSTYELPSISCDGDPSNCRGNYSQGDKFPIFIKNK